MSNKIDQKAYLQKYLGGPSVDKKKKKKKTPKGKGFKIILDDEVDITKLRPLDGDELDILDQGEDGPQIAGIIDERPEEVKKLEQFKTSSKWRVVTQDDGFSSKLQIEEIKKDVKEIEKENEVVFGKMYSDSEDEKDENNKSDSDPSPPRSQQSEKPDNRESKKKQLNNSDSDFSPLRKGRDSSPSKRHESPHRKRNESPSRKRNGSPPRMRKDSQDRKSKESSKRNRDSSPKRSKHNEKNYDSDISPPRKAETHKTKERIRKPSRWGDFEESSRQRSESPKRSRKKEESRKSRRDSSDSDASPPRKMKKDKRDKSSESDLSPPRKRKSPEKNDNNRNSKRGQESRKGNSLKDRRQSSDSDLSPPRYRKKSNSPPRKSKADKRKQRDSSSDISPPRRDRRNDVDSYKRNDDSPPPSNKKMEKTLEGKLAGLQNARQLRDENQAFRSREEEAFSKMTDDVSGRNAQVVSRKAKRETSEDRQKLKEKAERQKELDEKYKKWSRGLKQIEAENERMAQFAHEASKPLARLRDDRDLEHSLKEVERDGDPMLAYIRDKKRDRGDLGPVKPQYKGNFPPNRFNLRPGFRWDGVDRSNGYEKKYFDNQSKRKAQEEEAYKWSTEDL